MALPGFTSTASPATTLSPERKTLRRQNIGKLAVLVLDQRDEGGPVRIVLDTFYRSRHVELAALEVDIRYERL